jgi:hypothetical protein
MQKGDSAFPRGGRQKDTAIYPVRGFPPETDRHLNLTYTNR